MFPMDLSFQVSHLAVDQSQMKLRKRSRRGECSVCGAHLGCGISKSSLYIVNSSSGVHLSDT